jgi:hypothetical protein
MRVTSLATVAALAFVARASALQTYVDGGARIPHGAPANGGFTESIEAFDVDGDGDIDALWANGGELGNEQNVLWINQGGAQGGTIGYFADETAARLPAVLDDSRDVDFVDLEGDGDLDFFVSNTSGIANQTNRWLVNMGGAQGGAPGYFQDQTALRWVNVGVNDGSTTFSSVAPSVALASGGFVDWSCDTAFADLDGDGDPDLVNATYGSLSQGLVPARLFLNDGAGFFEEWNPSGYQLAGTDIPNGAPGLWCEGVQQHQTTDATGAQCDVANMSISVDVADVDADLDLDFLLGDKFELPRLIANRTEETGALAFRDVSHLALPGPNWAPGLGSYEQDFGDLDGDDDLDIFGSNWSNVCDTVLMNNAGTFAAPVIVLDTCVRHNEPDFVDCDNDGLLDVFNGSRTASEAMHRNPGAAGSFVPEPDTNAIATADAQTIGCDAADVDADGDYDLWLANDFGDENVLLENVSSIPDTHAPRVAHLEQAASRSAGPEPTVVRAHVYDNAPWYVAAFDDVALEYSVGGGAFASVAMRFSGGQVYRGEIPGWLVGPIDYRVRASDAYGNTGVSATASFVATACNGAPQIYCTAKVNSAGCTPSIGATGTPSLSAPSGFVVTAVQELDGRFGLFFYSRVGPLGAPYQGGYLCVKPPTVRTPVQLSAATGAPPCTGVYAFDFNEWLTDGGDPFLAAGDGVWGQYWSRDPQSSFTSNRTDGIQFFMCP